MTLYAVCGVAVVTTDGRTGCSNSPTWVGLHVVRSRVSLWNGEIWACDRHKTLMERSIRQYDDAKVMRAAEYWTRGSRRHRQKGGPRMTLEPTEPAAFSEGNEQ